MIARPIVALLTAGVGLGLLLGQCAPLLSRQSRRGAEALLVGHASPGALGFAALIAWTFSL